MASVKRGSVPPTHPTVSIGLGLAVLGLLLTMYAYTGARVYDVAFAFVALVGGLVALVGILVAAWGRSIMSSRASRSRRTAISRDALAMARPDEAPPTLAAPAQKRRFALPRPKPKKAPEPTASPGAALFAFRRAGPVAPDDPRHPEQAARLEPAPADPSAVEPAPAPAGLPVRARLRCPRCANEFLAEGVRPFDATCGACGFFATVA